jgi:hypothetical protein
MRASSAVRWLRIHMHLAVGCYPALGAQCGRKAAENKQCWLRSGIDPGPLERAPLVTNVAGLCEMPVAETMCNHSVWAHGCHHTT